MSRSLQKFTTEFLPEEDRLRLSGELEDGQQVVLWLTQRLLNRLVPHLCSWLEKQPVPGACAARPQAMALAHGQIHQLVQQAAQGALQAQQQVPVQARPCAFMGLVQIAKLETRDGRLQLALRVEQEPPAEYRVSFAPMALRQWLGIVFQQCERAQWPLEVWPQWMVHSGTTIPQPPGSGLLH